MSKDRFDKVRTKIKDGTFSWLTVYMRKRKRVKQKDSDGYMLSYRLITKTSGTAQHWSQTIRQPLASIDWFANTGGLVIETASYNGRRIPELSNNLTISSSVRIVADSTAPNRRNATCHSAAP